MVPRRGGHKDGTGLTTVDRSIKMRHNHSTELITKIYGFIFKRQTFNLSSENKRMYFALWTSSPGTEDHTIRSNPVRQWSIIYYSAEDQGDKINL